MKGRDFLAKLRENPEFAEAYDEIAPEYQIAQEIIRLRVQLGLTQQELAEKAGTAQPNISRLENAVGTPSLSALKRIASALGAEVKIGFVRAQSESSFAEEDARESFSVQVEADISKAVYPTVVWGVATHERSSWPSQLSFRFGEQARTTGRSSVYPRLIEAA